MCKKIVPSLTLILFAGLLAACSSGIKPLATNYVKATPQPLVLTANKVPVTINATFSENWFNKKASIMVTPVLRYDGGEAWGTSYTYQGEKVAGNGIVIPQKSGANVTMTSNFDYVPDMQNSELYLTFSVDVSGKTVDLPEIKIGEGVLATAALMNVKAESPAIAPDKFQRIIQEAYDADIMFLIQQAELRSSELRKSSLADWKKTVKNADDAENQNVTVEISAYASPDGGYELNEKLAEKREKNTDKYLKQELKNANVNTPVYARYTAQDWDGFKQLVEKSNIQDKELILSVLSMYKDPEQREREIKNISSVFSVLADEILPQLRRSRLTANVEIIGKSDEEIMNLVDNNPKALSVEELLYAATLTNNPLIKESIYKKTAERFPTDYRAFNNLGTLAYQSGNIAAAETYFNKALNMSGNSPEVNLNMGYIALVNDNKAKAEEYFGKASGIQELNNAMGLLQISEGNYSQAAASFGNNATNNAALAQLLSKDYNKATATLSAIANPDATTSYLKAVVGARTNNLNAVVSNLREAIKQNPTLAQQAATDLEFAKYRTNSDFSRLVR